MAYFNQNQTITPYLSHCCHIGHDTGTQSKPINGAEQMTVTSTHYTDNIIPWGWSSMGHGSAKLQVRCALAGVSKMRQTSATAANADFPPLGMDEAVTSDLGIVLLSRIARG